jgi:hypothetical protein
MNCPRRIAARWAVNPRSPGERPHTGTEVTIVNKAAILALIGPGSRADLEGVS